MKAQAESLRFQDVSDKKNAQQTTKLAQSPITATNSGKKIKSSITPYNDEGNKSTNSHTNSHTPSRVRKQASSAILPDFSPSLNVFRTCTLKQLLGYLSGFDGSGAKGRGTAKTLTVVLAVALTKVRAAETLYTLGLVGHGGCNSDDEPLQNKE